MLLAGHSGGVNWYEQFFGLPLTIVTWNSKLTSFWAHQGDENSKIITWIQDLPNPR